MRGRRRVAHEPDAPHLAGVGAEPAADLDAVAVEQQPPQLRLAGPVLLGDPDGGQFGQPVALGREQLEAPSRSNPSCRARPSLAVPLPALLQTLVQQAAQPGVEGEDHADGRRVVVGAGARRRSRSGRSCSGRGTRSAGVGSSRSTARSPTREGGQAGRHAQALLGGRSRRCRLPGVDLDGDAAERGDAVDEQQGVALALAQGLDVVADSGGRLGVDDGDHGRRGMGAEHAPRGRADGPTAPRPAPPRRRSGWPRRTSARRTHR